MNYESFSRILATFADNADAVANSKGELVVQIRDDVIHATVQNRSGDVYVIENGAEMSGTQWLIERIARLPILADRILGSIPAEPNFVTPSGDLQPQLNEASTSDESIQIPDVVESVRITLDARLAGTTSVLYLTSNAGEGKTTLINHVAHIQAQAYKERKSDWMLIPITLGGKPFLRFDDLIVGTLMNKLRFPFFYHNSFLELVKLGVLVPAFDGFEEMFVESSSGEALSALGNLVQSLESAGAILISARKAYFDYKSFANQARLFDTIRTDAAFSSLAINRWSKSQFLNYCEIRGLKDGQEVYDRVSSRFNESHPLLTRAVLVRRLIDVARTVAERDALLSKLGQAPHDYFFEFVNAIIEREAGEKWIDRSGEPARPLISVSEHHELLSSIAQEMWLASSNEIHTDSLELIVELNAEARAQDPKITRQVKERIPQHALLVSVSDSGASFAFDHEEFRDFFLGQAIGRRIVEGASSDMRSILREAPIPREALGAAVQYLKRVNFDAESAISTVMAFGQAELASSFIRENCGGLTIRLLSSMQDRLGMVVNDLTFPVDALANRKLSGTTFANCYFQSSELSGCEIRDCKFVKCRFDRLEMASDTDIHNSCLDECEVMSIVPVSSDSGIFDPGLIRATLAANGFQLTEESRPTGPEGLTAPDEDMILLDKLLRCFLRSTQVGDGVLKLRMGARANHFIKDKIPELLRHGILVRPVSGAGRESSYRLGVQMRDVDKAMAGSAGSYERFLTFFPDN